MKVLPEATIQRGKVLQFWRTDDIFPKGEKSVPTSASILVYWLDAKVPSRLGNCGSLLVICPWEFFTNSRRDSFSPSPRHVVLSHFAIFELSPDRFRSEGVWRCRFCRGVRREREQRWSHFQLSPARRAALKTTLRSLERQAEGTRSRHPHFPVVGGQLGIPLLLLPLILGLVVLASVARVIGSALRWMVIWCGGFLVSGLLAWGLNAVFRGDYSPQTLWAAGGYLGLVVLSSFYGICLEWLFWLIRHENNPYAGAVSLSPEQQAERVEFAKSLQWPTALASLIGGLMFAAALFPIIAGTETAWPTLATWALVGGLGLGVQGLLLGLYLGFRRNRLVFDASRSSLGEFVGWQIAGPHRGWRPALGWGLGYALHQLPTGAIAGLALGALTRLFFA